MRPSLIFVACASLGASAVTRTPTATPAAHSWSVESFSFPEKGLSIKFGKHSGHDLGIRHPRINWCSTLDSNFAGFQGWCTAPICMATCARLGYRCYRCLALSCMCSNDDCWMGPVRVPVIAGPGEMKVVLMPTWGRFGIYEGCSQLDKVMNAFSLSSIAL